MSWIASCVCFVICGLAGVAVVAHCCADEVLLACPNCQSMAMNGLGNFLLSCSFITFATSGFVDALI